jgi:hypothetical protein
MGCVCMTGEAVDAVAEQIVAGDVCEGLLFAANAKLDAMRAKGGGRPTPGRSESPGWLGGAFLAGFSIGLSLVTYWQTK